MKNDTHKSKTRTVFDKIFAFIKGCIGLFIIAPVYGLLTLGLITMIIMVVMISDEVTQQTRIWLIVSLTGIWVLVVTFIKLRKYRHRSLVKGVLGGLIVGMVIYAIMTIASTAGVVSPMVAGCSDLDSSRVSSISSATIPIATDLGRGTAFAIDDNGTLLTAYHVVKGAKEIYANYITGRVNITVYKTAPDYDLALLTMSKPNPSYLTLSSSYKVGDPLYAFGYPGNAFSAGQGSLSAGVVSRIITNEDVELNARGAAVPEKLEYIQTDTALNPGNSGGPVVGRCGVVGIVDLASDSHQLYESYGLVSEQSINYLVSSKTAAYVFGLDIK